MDGHTLTVLSGFLATWLQIALIYYKIGKLEQKVKDLCEKIKFFHGKR